MDANFYRTTKVFSGEMFDETATSFNNKFGFNHNIGALKYGINFPLSKFIEELEKILAGEQDDKSNKRLDRLNFLQSCIELGEIQDFFILFCNYLNGGGTDSTDTYWAKQQYYYNYIIITAAGGNIIILFAQLIMNMLDKFSDQFNKRFGKPNPMKVWNISDPNYVPSMANWDVEDPVPTYVENIRRYLLAMFQNPPESRLYEYNEIIIDTYNSLTPTNKLVLEGLEDSPEVKKKNLRRDQLCFLIVKHFFMKSTTDPTILANIISVARSKFSDFDFKLSPNIHPSLIVDDSYPPSIIAEFRRLGLFYDKIKGDENVESFIAELIASINTGESAGFLLFRIKTLIDNSADYEQEFNTKQLKEFQRDCARLLGPDAWSLFPQIMQDSYFEKVPKDSECWKFLNNLAKKKETIRQATQDAIDETLKFFLAGYYKRANIDGTTFALVESATNSTEAIINYINYTTYHLNIYIEHWETLKKKKYKLSKSAAPALHRGGLPRDFSHRSACYNFLSLDSILNSDKGLVARLASDIINYFLNNSMFNAENILDNLIMSFNIRKQQVLPISAPARMAPSDLLLVPTNPRFRARLEAIKEIMNLTRFSELGYPDGIRITLNAIESTDAPDKNMNSTETDAMSNIVLDLDAVQNKRQAPSSLASPSSLSSPIEPGQKKQMLKDTRAPQQGPQPGPPPGPSQGPPPGPSQGPSPGPSLGVDAMAEGLIKKLRVKKQKTKKQMRKKTDETSKRKKQEKAKKQIRESRKRKKQEKAKKQIIESRKRIKPALKH
jgi:hypothetical protein